jgi:hypothetical protein
LNLLIKEVQFEHLVVVIVGVQDHNTEFHDFDPIVFLEEPAIHVELEGIMPVIGIGEMV